MALGANLTADGPRKYQDACFSCGAIGSYNNPLMHEKPKPAFGSECDLQLWWFQGGGEGRVRVAMIDIFTTYTSSTTDQLLNIFYSVSHFTGSLYSSSDLNKIHLRHFNNKIRPPYFNPVNWFPWKQPRDPSPKTDSAAVHLRFNCGTSVSKKDINLNCSCSFSL